MQLGVTVTAGGAENTLGVCIVRWYRAAKESVFKIHLLFDIIRLAALTTYMLSRTASHPARLLLLRPTSTRLARSPRARYMTQKTSRAADDDNNAPAKKMSFTDTLRVKKITEHATLPVRGSDGAAGYDLAAAYDCGALKTRVITPAVLCVHAMP